MISGTSMTETEPYISKFDDARSEEEGATLFLLGALDMTQSAYLADLGGAVEYSQSGEMRMSMKGNLKALEACRFGLKGWRGKAPQGPDAVDIKFETNKRNVNGKTYSVVRDDVLEKIGFKVAVELGNKVLAINSLGMDEKQNFSTQ